MNIIQRVQDYAKRYNLEWSEAWRRVRIIDEEVKKYNDAKESSEKSSEKNCNKENDQQKENC